MNKTHVTSLDTANNKNIKQMGSKRNGEKDKPTGLLFLQKLENDGKEYLDRKRNPPKNYDDLISGQKEQRKKKPPRRQSSYHTDKCKCEKPQHEKRACNCYETQQGEQRKNEILKPGREHQLQLDEQEVYELQQIFCEPVGDRQKLKLAKQKKRGCQVTTDVANCDYNVLLFFRNCLRCGHESVNGRLTFILQRMESDGKKYKNQMERRKSKIADDKIVEERKRLKKPLHRVENTKEKEKHKKYGTEK